MTPTGRTQRRAMLSTARRAFRWGALGLTATGAAAAFRAVRRVEIAGDSMAPALLPGDRLVIVRWLPPRPGALVAVADPRQPARTLVKRLESAGPAGLVVAGDNPEHSTDSRHFGAVPKSAYQGRPVYRYSPAERQGRLGRRGPGTRG